MSEPSEELRTLKERRDWLAARGQQLWRRQMSGTIPEGRDSGRKKKTR